LKKRPLPDSTSHPSVGTEGDLTARAKSRKSLDALHLTRANVETLVLSMSDLQKWGYIVEVPEGPGGDRPSGEGEIIKCERCSQPFMVKQRPEADECLYHWGRLYNRSLNGAPRSCLSLDVVCLMALQARKRVSIVVAHDLWLKVKDVFVVRMSSMNPSQRIYIPGTAFLSLDRHRSCLGMMQQLVHQTPL